MEKEVYGGTICYWCIWNHPQKLSKGIGIFSNQRTNEDHSDGSIVKIGQNIKKDSRKFEETIKLL